MDRTNFTILSEFGPPDFCVLTPTFHYIKIILIYINFSKKKKKWKTVKRQIGTKFKMARGKTIW